MRQRHAPQCSDSASSAPPAEKFGPATTAKNLDRWAPASGPLPTRKALSLPILRWLSVSVFNTLDRSSQSPSPRLWCIFKTPAWNTLDSQRRAKLARVAAARGSGLSANKREIWENWRPEMKRPQRWRIQEQ